MAVLLEQDEIDRMIMLEQEKVAKRENAKTAREKIGEMYEHATGMMMENELNTIADIGEAVTLIEQFINNSSEYMPSFRMLKRSYEAKVVNM